MGALFQQLRHVLGSTEGKNKRRAMHCYIKRDGDALDRDAAKVSGAAHGRQRGDCRRAGAAQQKRARQTGAQR